MKREDYKNNVWYPVTNETYWVEEYSEEFPNCHTILICTNPDLCNEILTKSNCYLGWATMAKWDEWMFMIIEKPKTTI